MMTKTTHAFSPLSARAACTNATGPRPKLEPVRGVLYPERQGVEHGRLWPSAELEPFIEHFWWVRWALQTPRVSEVLSYPSVHVVFERAAPQVVGVVRSKFTRRLEGEGSVFAIKFQPGMFRPLHGVPAWRLTGRTLPLGAELGREPGDLARELDEIGELVERARLLETALRSVLPPLDPDAELARELVTRVRTDPTLRSVAALAGASGIAPRGLQRLFREYVGVGPKWVVRRFRLQEAAELLRAGDETVAGVAATLGYCDQAHFARDFKAVVGATPVDYAKRARDAGPFR